MSAELLNISFRLMTEKTFCHSLKSSLLISDVKALIETDSEIAPENQRLIFKGQLLKDDCTLKSYGVESGSTIHVVGRAVRPIEPESSCDNVQSSSGNENGIEGSDGANADGQGSGSVSRGVGMPMGMIMSPIYATISVSTPVAPTASENSMEQVATQFFSGVVNSLLSTFNSSQSTNNAQSGSAQALQPQDELVTDLETSTGILKNVTASIRSLYNHVPPTPDPLNESGPIDVRISSVSNLIPSDSSNPPSGNGENAPGVCNTNVEASAIDCATTSQYLDSINVPVGGSNTYQGFNNDGCATDCNIQNSTGTSTAQINNTNRYSLRSKKSISESASKPNVLDSNKRGNSLDHSCGVVSDDALTCNSSSYRSEHADDEHHHANVETHQSKNSDNGYQSNGSEARRGRLRLIRPDLVTSKLPWDSLKKLEQKVQEIITEFKEDLSEASSDPRICSFGVKRTRGGLYLRSSSSSRIELSSSSNHREVPESARLMRSSSEGSEQLRSQVESRDSSTLDLFLRRLDSANSIINATMNRYVTEVKIYQMEMYKLLSSAFAIQTTIYASMCAIFSWMHSRLLSPESARIFSSRLGWNGPTNATPSIQNSAQTPQGSFSFATYSTYVTRDQTPCTEDTQGHVAESTHSTENTEESNEN